MSRRGERESGSKQSSTSCKSTAPRVWAGTAFRVTQLVLLPFPSLLLSIMWDPRVDVASHRTGHRSFPRTQSEQTLSAFSSRRIPRGCCQSLFVIVYFWTLLYDVSLVAQAELEQTCLARASPMQSQSRKSTHQGGKDGQSRNQHTSWTTRPLTTKV